MDPILNAFGQPAIKTDVFGAFEFLSEGQKYVRPRVFKACCAQIKLDVNSKALFNALDIRNKGSFEFEDMETVFFQKRESWSKDMLVFFSELLSCDFMFDTSNRCTLTGGQIVNLLRDTKGKWQKRIVALHEFVIKYTNEEISDEAFDLEFKKVKKGWTLQIRDRRSAVVRTATTALAKLGQRRSKIMSRHAGSLVEVLFECVRMKIECISLAGIHCLHSIISSVPDPRKKLPIFSQLCHQAREKFVDSRRIAMVLITKKIDFYIEHKNTIVGPVWKKLDALLVAVKFGLRDADAEVRVMSYGLMARAEILEIPGVDDTLRKLLHGVPRRAYEDEKQRLKDNNLLPIKLGGKGSVERKESSPRSTRESPVPDKPINAQRFNGRGPYTNFAETNPEDVNVGYDNKMSEVGISKSTAAIYRPKKQNELDLQDVLSSSDGTFSDVKIQSLDRMTSLFMNKSITDETIRKAMSIIQLAETHAVDQIVIELYLVKHGFDPRLIGEGYKEYLGLNNFYEKVFPRRPLGISVVVLRGNAIVSSVQDYLYNDIQLGSRVIAINGRRMDNRGYKAVMKELQNGKLPLAIRFKRRRAKTKNSTSPTNSVESTDTIWNDEEVDAKSESILNEMKSMMASTSRQSSGMNNTLSHDIQAIKIMHNSNRQRP